MIFANLFIIYIYIYYILSTIITGEGNINLRVGGPERSSREGSWEGWRKEKEEAKWCIYILIKICKVYIMKLNCFSIYSLNYIPICINI